VIVSILFGDRWTPFAFASTGLIMSAQRRVGRGDG
jgi:hypothetical protein